MANKSKLSKVGTVLFRGGVGCILVTVLAIVATGIYEWTASLDGMLTGMLVIILGWSVVPIGVLAIVWGIRLRKRALKGSSSESTGDE